MQRHEPSCFLRCQTCRTARPAATAQRVAPGGIKKGNLVMAWCPDCDWMRTHQVEVDGRRGKPVHLPPWPASS